MNCPQCGTAFPAPNAGQGTRLQCNTCGARLYAWLGDHFGTRDVAAPAVRAGGGTNVGVIVLVVLALFVLFTCFCLPMLANML
jgi:hypothetical protein